MTGRLTEMTERIKVFVRNAEQGKIEQLGEELTGEINKWYEENPSIEIIERKMHTQLTTLGERIGFYTINISIFYREL